MNRLHPGATSLAHGVASVILSIFAAPGCGSPSAAPEEGAQVPTATTPNASEVPTSSPSEPEVPTSSPSEPVAPTSNPNEPDEPICDGSNRLRLRFFYEPDYFHEPAANAVLIELGNRSIGIDGHCRYWLNGGWTNGKADRHLPWTSGDLPGELADKLDAAINLRTLDALECQGATTADHKNYYSIRSEYSRRRCEVGLDATEFFQVFRILDERALELYAAGTPMDGALHLAVDHVPWPLEMQYTWPVDSIAIDTIETELTAGHSLLVTDPEAVHLMRQLRGSYLADRAAPDAPYNWPEGIPIASIGQVLMRDAVPYELPNGLWPWSDE